LYDARRVAHIVGPGVHWSCHSPCRFLGSLKRPAPCTPIPKIEKIRGEPEVITSLLEQREKFLGVAKASSVSWDESGEEALARAVLERCRGGTTHVDCWNL
jgi:hypothetical protein